MKKVERVNAILIELVVVILFFAIAAIITIQLFVMSYDISLQSSAKTDLNVLLEQQMEEYRSGKGFVGKRTIYYDKSLSECDKSDAYYTEEIITTLDEEYPLVNVDVKVTDYNNDLVVSFDTSYVR